MADRALGNPLGNPLGLLRQKNIGSAYVKSMQRGSVPYSALTVDISLSKAVTPNNCVVFVNSGSRSGANIPSAAGCTAISEENISFKVSGNGTDFSWVLLDIGAIKGVTRGSITFASGAVQVAIPATGIDLSKSFVLLSVSPDTVFSTATEIWHVSVWFDYATGLAKRTTSGQAVVIDYQIVEFK